MLHTESRVELSWRRGPSMTSEDFFPILHIRSATSNSFNYQLIWRSFPELVNSTKSSKIMNVLCICFCFCWSIHWFMNKLFQLYFVLFKNHYSKPSCLWNMYAIMQLSDFAATSLLTFLLCISFKLELKDDSNTIYMYFLTLLLL